MSSVPPWIPPIPSFFGIPVSPGFANGESSSLESRVSVTPNWVDWIGFSPGFIKIQDGPGKRTLADGTQEEGVFKDNLLIEGKRISKYKTEEGTFQNRQLIHGKRIGYFTEEGTFKDGDLIEGKRVSKYTTEEGTFQKRILIEGRKIEPYALTQLRTKKGTFANGELVKGMEILSDIVSEESKYAWMAREEDSKLVIDRTIRVGTFENGEQVSGSIEEYVDECPGSLSKIKTVDGKVIECTGWLSRGQATLNHRVPDVKAALTNPTSAFWVLDDLRSFYTAISEELKTSPPGSCSPENQLIESNSNVQLLPQSSESRLLLEYYEKYIASDALSIMESAIHLQDLSLTSTDPSSGSNQNIRVFHGGWRGSGQGHSQQYGHAVTAVTDGSQLWLCNRGMGAKHVEGSDRKVHSVVKVPVTPERIPSTLDNLRCIAQRTDGEGYQALYGDGHYAFKNNSICHEKPMEPVLQHAGQDKSDNCAFLAPLTAWHMVVLLLLEKRGFSFEAARKMSVVIYKHLRIHQFMKVEREMTKAIENLQSIQYPS